MNSFLPSLFPHPEEPGACLVVARHGQVEFLDCRGLADLGASTPIGPETNFRLASVSKQFTAGAILLLREAGKLQLSDPLQKYFPDFPSHHPEPITLHHLLQHTSGILDYEDHLPRDLDRPVLDADVLEIAKACTSTYFPPGREFRYSNTGYALLACIVELVTGQPYAVALEQMIFHPLGMKNTVARDERHRPHVPHRALGYRRMEDGSIQEADQSLTSSVLGDGGIYCSASDYLLWDRALWEGALLPPAVVQEMMTPGELKKPDTPPPAERVWFPDDMNEERHQETPDSCILLGGEPSENGDCRIPYGLGWRLETNDAGLPVAYHPGSTTGFMHCVRRVPAHGLTILVLANRSVARSKELARDVEKHLLQTRA